MGFELEVADVVRTRHDAALYKKVLQDIIGRTAGYNFSLKFRHNYWEQHMDGGGIEIGSPVFTDTDQYGAIPEVTEVLFRHKFRPRPGAGVHVHLALAPFRRNGGVAEAVAFQRFLISLEAGVFALSALTRVANSHGMPYVEQVHDPSSASVLAARRRDYLKAFKAAKLGHPFLTFVRTPGVNGNAVMYAGRLLPRGVHDGWCGWNAWDTIECRCFPSTLSGPTIINWMRTLELVVAKFKHAYAERKDVGYFPYMCAGWSRNLDMMDDVADHFMTYLGAPADLHQWAVEQAAVNYRFPVCAVSRHHPYDGVGSTEISCPDKNPFRRSCAQFFHDEIVGPTQQPTAVRTI